jgi:hypothetical protein
MALPCQYLEIRPYSAPAVARRSHWWKRYAEFLFIPKRDTGLISDLDGNRHVREENSGASNHSIFGLPTRALSENAEAQRTDAPIR